MSAADAGGGNPVTRLLRSSKALVVLTVTGATLVAFFQGRVTWQEATDLLKYLLGAWLLSQGAEDAAKHMAGRLAPSATAVVGAPALSPAEMSEARTAMSATSWPKPPKPPPTRHPPAPVPATPTPTTTHPKGADVNITILNHSTDPQVSPAILQEIARAVESQLYQHYAGFAQSAGAPVRVITQLSQAGPDDEVIAVFDTPDQANALGWHSVTPDGRPYGKVFWGPVRDNGGTLLGSAGDPGLSLSAVISHEALESVGNPYVNDWHDMPDGQTEDATELADRVEGDAYLMPGTRVHVSNFLGPRSFRPGPGPYDWMRLCRAPFEVRPGGYAIRRVGGPSGDVQPVYGEAFPSWKKELKEHPSSRLSRRRRAQAAPPQDVDVGGITLDATK